MFMKFINWLLSLFTSTPALAAPIAEATPAPEPIPAPEVPKTEEQAKTVALELITISTPTLQKGMQGGDVKAAQKRMNELLNAGLTVDGDFGNKTEAAVKAMEKSKGWKQDGILGADSLKLLGLVYQKPATPVPAPVQPAPVKGPYTHQHPLDWLRAEGPQPEKPGKLNNDRITWYHQACDNIGGVKKKHPDEVPWCSSVLNRAAMECGCEKTNNALASSWDKYVGKAYKKGDMIPEGAIVRIAHPGGHVTLANKAFKWTGSGKFEGCGGNQGNRIKVSSYSQSTIKSIHDWAPKAGTKLAPIGSKSGGGVSDGDKESTR